MAKQTARCRSKDTDAEALLHMVQAQAEAAIAQSRSEQLVVLLDSAEQERDSALHTAAQREEAIRVLEIRLAERQVEEATPPTRDPLVDLASLCDALPSENATTQDR